MRELTSDELALVSGGAGGDSYDEQDRWWSDAFNWLSDSLSWLDTLVPGWIGDYIGNFGEVVDSMHGHGDMIWDRAGGYNDYVIDQQSSGEDFQTFEEWNNAQGN